MKNFRFLIQDQFEANNIANDLRVQMYINRFHDVNIVAVNQRNEVIVQVHEANENVEETLESFMRDYQSGVILE
ncbi:hypothetical protein [Bacillus sp. MRMR6]|uniref:hypothetical protein n=1 Tax=Bacillus sp. MRMR6 TaxID=1928617 RepID=UPI0009526D7F|nr:hypothetical protein [Bacillus sp. MRMR6]OLS39954.1 hypothetical protein BTR25_12220 [Bacillus sp. MRMR6]